MTQDYLNELIERYPALSVCRNSIQGTFQKLETVFAQGGKLLIAGNGGSAADCDHISGELLKGFGHARPLSPEWEDKLGPNLASNLQGSLPVIPLPQLSGLSTAYANDCNGDYTFAQLTFGLGQPQDALLCISTSGNSKNVCHAAEVARAKGLTTLGLTGATGGKLKDLVDTCICAPETEVYKIQEYHLPIYHTLCFMIEEAFFPKNIAETAKPAPATSA